MKRTSLWQRITALLLAVLLVAGYVPVQQVNAAETAMATVEALSPNLNVGSNGTAGISITATEGFTLQWVAADPSVGRTQDGWWAGFKVIAPEGIDLTDAVYYWNYADGTSSARKFWNVKDSSDDAETHWVGIWKLITPEALNEALQADKKFTQLWSFDWEGDGTCEQTVSLTLDPTKVILKTGDVQNYPNYGTVSAITSGVSLNATNPAEAELSLAETITLDYDEANPDINRSRSGWWIGVKVVAPQLDVEVLRTATYTRKETNEPDKAREFWKNKDSKDDDQTHWIGLWAYVTPEKLTALEAGEMLTHSWEFNWDNNAGIDQVVTIKLDPAKLILNKDGAQQYPCYGNVSVITGAEVITLTGSGTSSALAEVQAPLKTLVWAPADTSIGRYADGWWIGLKVEAPAGFTEAQADQVTYIRGSGENWESWDNARPFSEYKDGPTHITIWAPITEKILADAINAGVEVLSWSWKFDWLNSGDETKMQVVTIQVDPTLVELTNRNGDTGFRFPADPLYGTVSGLTDGITVTENASANVSASNEGKTDVVLQWADTSEGRPAEGWWAGIRIDLPEALKGESFDPTGITLQTMGTAGTWSKAIEFKDAYEYDGTSQYLTLWGLINEDRWDTGSDLVYKMRIDWNKDGIYEQLVTLTVDPQNYILKKGDDQVRPHSIGFSVTNGKVNVYGEEYPATITVDYQGGELTYTITPDENYHIQSIQHGDTVLDAFNEADHGKGFTYTFTPNGDVEVTATIVPDQRSFTVVETGKGEIDGNEATTEFSSVDYGTSASCTITAAKGYKAFVGEEVVADGTNGEASGTYTVENITEDTVVTVDFCLVEYTITYHSPLGEVPAKENYTIETKDQALAQISGVTGAKFLGWTVGAATQNRDETVITTISGSDKIADIELYAVFNVSASFTAQRDGMTILPDTWYDGNRATLEIYTEVKGEGIEYAYSCGEEKGKTPDKVDVSVSGAAEKTYMIDSVTLKDNETSYVYAVATNGFTLKLDDSKPTIAIREGENTIWETWVDMVIDQVKASNAEKEFTVETTDSGSDAVKVSYVFVPFEKAIAKGIHPSNIDEVLAALGCSWSDYTDKISTSEIENGEYSAYALIVRATDAVGNTSYVDSNGLLFDTIAPVIDVAYAYGNGNLKEAQSASDTTADTKSESSFYSNEDIVVTVTLKDDYLDPAGDKYTYSIQLNGKELPEEQITWDENEPIASFTLDTETYSGVNTLTVTVKDEAGNETKYDSGNLVLDKIAPTITTMTIQKAQSAAQKALNFLTFGIFFNGEIEVVITVQDELSLNFDGETYPDQVASAHMHIEGVEKPVPGTAVAEKPGEFIFKLPDTVLEEDIEKDITFTATDAAGNTSESVEANDAPYNHSSNTFLYETTEAVVNFSANNDATVTYESNGQRWMKKDQAFTFVVTDLMEKKNTSGIRSVIVTNNGAEVLVSNTDGADSTNGKFYYTGENVEEVKTYQESYSIAYGTLAEGVNEISVTVTDNAGNEVTKTYTVYVDRTEPEIDVDYTYQNAGTQKEETENQDAPIYSNGDIIATITITDAHLDDANKDNAAEGFATVTLTSSTENKATLELVAGSEKWNEDHTQWTAQYKISSAEKTETVSQLSISVADETGNKAAYGSNSLLIDRVVPEIAVSYRYDNGNVGEELTASDKDNFYANGNIVATVTVTDKYLDYVAGDEENELIFSAKIEAGDLTPDEVEWTREESDTVKWVATYTIETEAVNQLNFTVKDEAGNETKYGSGELILDRTAPVIASMTIEKVQSDAEAILNFLTFGIFFNGHIEVTISVEDNLSINYDEETYPEGQITSALMYIDGEAILPANDGKNGEFTFALPKKYADPAEAAENLVNLAKIISFTATDAAGNTCEPVEASDAPYNHSSNTFLYETTKAVVDFSANESDSVTFKNGSQLWMLKDQAFTFVVTDLMEGKNTSGIRSVTVKIKNDTTNEEFAAVKVKNEGEGRTTSDNGIFTYADSSWDPEDQIFTASEKFSIDYATLADGKNEISVAMIDNAGNETDPVTYTVYVDKIEPEVIEIAFDPASEYEEGNHKEFYHEEVYGFYFSQDTVVTITANDPTGNSKKDDISGVAAIHYILDDIDNENDQNVVVTSAELQDNAISFTIPANFKGQIYALALDNVNNFRQNQDGESEFVAPDGTIIANQARHDEVASVTIERAETAWKDHAGHDLYSGDVKLDLTAIDSYAGLRSVEWYVELEGEKLISGMVEIDNEGNMTGDAWFLDENGRDQNLITKLTRTHTVGNNVEGTGFRAYLKLTDRIGHTSEVENVFSIDRTDPTCEVTYNAPAQTVGNTSYYNQPLVATITITELNFNPDDFVVTVNGTPTNVTWNSEGDKNVAILTLNADNTYVIGVTGQDMAKNAMKEYLSENYVVDQTDPTCKVTYNAPAQTVGNTSYYNQPLVAEIEITELNFNPDDFVVTVNGTSTNVTWKSEGSKNVATLTLSADNTYVIGVTGQDMAKNAMEEYVSENHVVDQIAPVCNVTFSEEANPVGDISYHDEPLVATITIDELNFNENDFVVTVNGEATAVDWNPVDGDTHTVTLTFTEDGEYIIGVTGQDMARNAMEEYTSNTRIVDQNAPTVVTDLQHESANNEENIGFTITIADQNLPVENIKAELTMVIHTGDGFTAADFETQAVTLEAPVEIEWDEGRPIAYTITVPNLDTDGYYTLTLTVTDHAGNVTTLINAANTPEGQDGFEAVNFSVNREGSVFWIETEHTDKYAEGAPLKNQLFGAYANDNVKVIIHEINVDQVDIGENQTSLNINDGSSTTDVTLVEGTNYAKNQESGLGGWFENIYTLDNSNFEKDGMYSLSLLTYDKAENSNINTKQTEEGAEPTGTIRFTVDRTNPVISTNVYQDQRINEPQYVVEFQIADANLDESSLVVLVNGEIVSGSALTSLGGNIYQFTITDGLNQTIEITAKDKAKNPSEPCLIENVTVSTNILVLWYANTPLFWGTVGGFVALAALIAWLLIAKKRKEEKAEAK